MKRIAISIAVLSLVAVVGPALRSGPSLPLSPKADRPQQVAADGEGVEDVADDPLKTFMRAKLKSSQGVLEGLVTDDFALIRKQAQQMIVMSHAASWQVFKTPQYDQHSAEFRRHAERLVEVAKKENAEGATLAYLQLTMSCVNCHRHVASVKTTSAQPFEFRDTVLRSQVE